MEILHPRCAGSDVHKKVVVATILVSDEHGQLTKKTRSFETMTTSLLALSDWLTGYTVSHVAMESTGEYTPPIMLPMVSSGLYRGRTRDRADPKDNTELLFVYLHALD